MIKSIRINNKNEGWKGYKIKKEREKKKKISIFITSAIVYTVYDENILTSKQ